MRRTVSTCTSRSAVSRVEVYALYIRYLQLRESVTADVFRYVTDFISYIYDTV